MKLIVALSLLCCVIDTWAIIRLKGNGYEGIVIVISEDTPEDPTLVPSLKELLKNATNFMLNATGGLAYFKEATLVIPPHWSYDQNVITINNRIPLSAAHIRIDKPNPAYGISPYTLQPGECMEPGKYIHLTPKFVINKDGSTVSEFGDLGRQLVHEWAHFRYGVFDEYGITGSKKYPAFYMEGDDYVPTTCSRRVPGYLEDAENGDCFVDKYTFSPDTCYFSPAEDKITMKASIMYLPFIPSVTEFCDDSKVHEHNNKAPSQQNLMCDNLPTWNVISFHDDFSDIQAKYTGKSVDVKLNIVQPRHFTVTRYVIVLDYSISMYKPVTAGKLRRMSVLQLAVERALSVLIPDKSLVGLVKFALTAEVLSNLTEIDSTSRNTLISQVKLLRAHGSQTCIACGVSKGIEVVGKGGTILLVTDGTATTGNVKNITNEIEASDVTIDTIAIGNEADADLSDLAKLTGGKSFFFSDGDKDLTRLDQAFYTSVQTQRDINDIPIQLDLKSLVVAPSNSQMGEIFIDESVGKDTKFSFSSGLSMDSIALELMSPDKTTYSNMDAGIFSYNKDLKIKAFLISDAKVGKWTYKITNQHPTNNISCSVTVNSHKRRKSSRPIRVSCSLGNLKINLTSQTHLKILCQVSKGYDAIIKATVSASVLTPDNSYFNIKLHDDGSGADTIADDGFYTGYFFSFDGDNRYSIVGNVKNDGKARVLVGTKSSSGPKRTKGKKKGNAKESFPLSDFRRRPKGTKKNESLLTEPAEIFMRSVTADSFFVKNFVNFSLNKIPPYKITDLHVLQTSDNANGTRIVRLKWTSSGNHYDIGTAKEVEVRFGTSLSQISNSFTTVTLVNQSDLVAGSLKSLSAPHESQEIEIHLDSINYPNRSLYFGIKTINQDNVGSSLSNIAQANFIKPSEILLGGLPITDTTTLITTETKTSTELSTESSISTELSSTNITKSSDFSTTETSTKYPTTTKLPTSTKSSPLNKRNNHDNSFWIAIGLLSALVVILSITTIFCALKYKKMKTAEVTNELQMSRI